MNALRDVPGGWYAMAKLAQLRRGRGLRRLLYGIPILLFASPAGPRALVDRCPHRGAPLSAGRILEDGVQCGYHGWRFQGSGELVAMPGLAGAPPPARVQALETCVDFGLVFVKVGEAASRPYRPAAAASVGYWHALEGRAHAALVDAAENFLDAVHTYFVHRHLFRIARARAVRVEVSAQGPVAQARYHEGGDTGGVIPGLLGSRQRVLSVGRFVGPNVAEVEFHGPRGLQLVMTGFMTPAGDGEVRGYGVVGLPGPRPWAVAKLLLLLPWIHLVYRQDRAVLERTAANNAAFGEPGISIAPLDLLRPQIEAILQGRTAPAERVPVVREIIL